MSAPLDVIAKEAKHAICLKSIAGVESAVSELNQLRIDIMGNIKPPTQEDTDRPTPGSLADFLDAAPQILQRIENNISTIVDEIRNALL